MMILVLSSSASLVRIHKVTALKTQKRKIKN